MYKLAKVFWDAALRLTYDGGLANAGNVALSLLLALFPFMLVVAVLVNVFGEPQILERVLEITFSHWPAGTAAPIAEQMKVVLGQATGNIFSLSTVIALILATNGVESARDGLNRAYRFEETRSFLHRRLQGSLFIVFGALGFILAGFILIGTPVVWKFVINTLPGVDQFAVPVGLLQYGVAGTLLVLTLFSFHYFLPDGYHQPGDVIWGLLLTIAGIIIGSRLFAIYLTSYANYTALYAGFAGIMVAIVYLYYISVLILFGAEFNAVLKQYRKGESEEPQED